MIDADPVLNILYGDNGAGKTSILESLVVLAKGRSFRSPSIKSLIGPGNDCFRVVADIVGDDGAEHRLGIERTATSWRGRRDGEDVQKFSELGRDMPLVIMEPDSHELITGSPERRRRYLDWGVFHVEPGFLSTWRRYDRALRQRNAALRKGQLSLVEALDPQLGQLGGALDSAREKQCEAVSARLAETMPVLAPELETIEVTYRRGWTGSNLGEALAANRERDMERGSTHSGPHRGDMGLLTSDGPARERLSRGECKTLSAGLLLSQANLLMEQGAQPVLLFDDLASELDDEHRERVMIRALGMGLQTWVTGTSRVPVKEGLATSARTFHVEHGQALEMV